MFLVYFVVLALWLYLFFVLGGVTFVLLGQTGHIYKYSTSIASFGLLWLLLLEPVRQVITHVYFMLVHSCFNPFVPSVPINDTLETR